jgi:hypothetical protein
MDLTASYLLVLTIASLGILGPLAVLAVGLRIERQPWADVVINGGAVLAGSGVLALFFVDNLWYAQFGGLPRVGLIFAAVWAVFTLGGFLPLALVVTRRRAARGWSRRLRGDSPPGTEH